MPELNHPEDVKAAAALCLALFRRWFSAQIIDGTADVMQITRMIEAAAEEASLNEPDIEESRILAHSLRLKLHIQTDDETDD